MENDGLETCQRCGGTPRLFGPVGWYNQARMRWCVKCMKCGQITKMCNHALTAVNLWNEEQKRLKIEQPHDDVIFGCIMQSNGEEVKK